MTLLVMLAGFALGYAATRPWLDGVEERLRHIRAGGRTS